MTEEKKNNTITKSIREENKRLKKDKKRRNIVIFVFLLLILALVFILVSRFMVVAYVNGRPISRFSVIKQLESQAGQEVVDNLILLLSGSARFSKTTGNKLVVST